MKKTATFVFLLAIFFTGFSLVSKTNIYKKVAEDQSYSFAQPISAYDRAGNSSSQSTIRTFKVDGSVTTPVVTPTNTTTPTYSFTKNLFYGQENSDVLSLQIKLKSLGYFSASVTPNGYFGRQTLTAVIKYQRAMGISTTGYVGPLTRGRLNQ